MKTFLLTILLTYGLVGNIAYAQFDAYRFSISGQKANFLLKGYYVERVINGQDEDTILGSFQTESGKITRLVAFGGTITDEIDRFLKSTFPQSEGMLPLIVRINKIEILGVTTSKQETSITKMNLSFIRRDGRRFYHLYDAATLIRQEGFDYTNALPGYIVHALQTCFADLRSAILLNHTDNQELNETELISNPLNTPERYSIFHAGLLRRGIYRTFYDFRDCQPDTSLPFQVHYGSKNDTLAKARITFPVYQGSGRIWGFCDGHDMYMDIGSGYYKLFPEKHRIISHVAYQDLSVDIAPFFLGGSLLGGILGSMVAGAIVGASAKGVTDPSEDGYFKVDFCSGDLIPADSPEFPDFNSRIIFNLAVNTDTSVSLCIFINKTFHVSLKRGQFYSLRLPHKLSDVGIELRSNNNLHCSETIPVKKYQSDFYLITISKKKGIRMDRPSTDVRGQLLEGMMLWNTVGRKEKGIDPGCSE